MSDQDLEKTVDAMTSLQNDLTTSREKALAFLVKSGMVTSDGELTPQYQQSA